MLKIAGRNFSRVRADRDMNAIFSIEGLFWGGIFADMDVGKGREQDAVSFGSFFLLLRKRDLLTWM